MCRLTILEMVLKHCKTRIKPFYTWNKNNKLIKRDIFGNSTIDLGLSDFFPVKKSLIGLNTSRCLHCVIAQGKAAEVPSFSKLHRPSWTWTDTSGSKDNGFLKWRKQRTFVRDLCTSIKDLRYDLKAVMPMSGSRKMWFDTHAVVKLLEENGFSTQHAELIVKVLVRTTHSNMDIIYSDMVTKVQQEIMLQRVMSQIASVKKDMIILEKSEFSSLLNENEKIKTELMQLKVQLAAAMNRVRSDTLLDLNLEKSRVKELKAEHDKKLLETRSEIIEMTAEQDHHSTRTNMKIDTEVAGLKTMLESHKLDTIKYLAGSVFTSLTVVLGFFRIWA